MKLKNLEYLEALHKYGHFGKAADACAVSQPALSIQLKKFEEELGLKLFERSNKTVLITDEGQKISEKAQEILQSVKELRDLAKTLKDPYHTELHIGAFPTLSPYIFPKVIADFKDSYPNMKFFLVEEKTETLIESLLEAKVDLAFIALPFQHDSLECESLFREDFFLGVSPNNPLSKKLHVEIQTLKEETLLLLDEGHCLRDQALDFCASHQVSEDYDFRGSSLETLRQMVLANVGVTLFPDCSRKDDSLSYLPFKGKAPAREIAMFWRKTSFKKEIILEIVDDLKRLYS